MRTLKTYLTALSLTIALQAVAQPGTWDKEKYPDLPSPTPTSINMKAYKAMKARIKQQAEEGKRRPDHLNNALNPSFPPIINQSGGSCGAASSIYYQFTNQINTARFTAADSDERRYATHFPWMLNTNGPDGTGYDRLGQNVGIASCAVYGGTTYSRIYGRDGQDDQDDDCGWMQGYDKWFSTMHNRILSGNSFPYNCGTEEGRELVKNYLWNRCGDESYSSGGICGIGVAAGPFEGAIPKTETNDAIGLTGKKYVTDWNETYNHAMTIVGYDDRVEFDLDGNGIIGEAKNSDGDNEVGAWIICNSWGDGYANKGFIYCPYERSNSVKGWPKENSFTPGYYDVVRDYRPLRTLKVTMEYSHRSEMALYIGVSQNLESTKPEKYTALTHFEYCGDGNRGKTQPAPEIPMLGRWADGELHTEPMEFGYDLTALTKDFDASRPLKYFFWVETRSWGQGQGKIYNASIIDYTLDRDGMEVPFDIPEPVTVLSAGSKTTLTAVVCGDAVPSPRNLAIKDGKLAWEAPTGSRYEPDSYNIYRDGDLFENKPASTLTTIVEPTGCYTVSAVYKIGDYDVESKQSTPVAANIEPDASRENEIARLRPGTKILIPQFIERSLENFTIEFWLWANGNATDDEYGFRIKADTTTYFFKITKNNYIEIGQDGGSYSRVTTPISPGSFRHIAIVVEGLYTRLYVNGIRRLNWANNYSHYGIKGPARLLIGETEGTTTNYKKVYDSPWNAYIDEFRFWNRALSQAEIKDAYQQDIANPTLYADLVHYYKMNTRGTGSEGDPIYLIDACGNCDAEVIGASTFSQESAPIGNSKNPLATSTTADFTCAKTATVGKPFAITDQSAMNTAQRSWTFTGTDEPTMQGTVSPVIVFTQAGQQIIKLQTTSLYGETAEKSDTIDVEPAVLPTVDFTTPEGDIGAGEHVTFINTSTPIEAASYEWEIEGADIPVVKTVNAGATFSANGTYEVKLTAINTEGRTSVTKRVSVNAVAPKAAFDIQNNIVVKGQPINLFDASKYSPDNWTWDLASNLEIYRYQGQNKSVTINEPGIYDVTLSVSNVKGSDQITRKKAVVVCNADGQTGLHFDGVDDLVEAASPFGSEVVKAFTIDWWMYPGRINDNSFHIGDKASTLQLYVKPTGEISIDVGGVNGVTPAGAVIFDEWHHYAVTFRSSNAIIYRDGKRITSVRVGSTVPVLEHFTIGGTEHPFNGIIDELRVWNKTYAEKDIITIANEPISAPADVETLLLYYDFNQNSGDVIDRSAHGITGKRINFGPDGDAWDNTLGIFYLNPRGTMQDVTANYLKNYKHPFKTGSGTVNPANSSRYLKLLMNNSTSPWKQLNTVKNGNILTEWHVDAEKNNYLTLEDTYSGFEENIKDLMIFQTVELPAGQYTFTADRDGDTYHYNWLPDGTYIAAALGDELPITDKLSSEALAWSPLAESQSVTFMLEEPTTVSLGLIANMTDKKCVAVGKFVLQYKELIYSEGTDPDAICTPTFTAEPTLEATGGLGYINIRVNKPQRVVVSDISGKTIFADWLETSASIPARRGIYIVNRTKVLVR